MKKANKFFKDNTFSLVNELSMHKNDKKKIKQLETLRVSVDQKALIYLLEQLMRDHVKQHKAQQQSMFSLNQRFIEWNLIPKNPLPQPGIARSGTIKDVTQKESDNKLEMLQINKGDILSPRKKGGLLSVAQINETHRLLQIGLAGVDKKKMKSLRKIKVEAPPPREVLETQTSNESSKEVNKRELVARIKKSSD